MKISRLISKRSKVYVLFDNEESIYLRYDTVLKFGLKKNDEITEKLLSRLLSEDYKLQIKELSFRLLTRRMHSVLELKRKLIKKKFPPESVEETVSELVERNYLDDRKFAEKYSEEKLKNNKTGVIKIRAELIQRGVDKGIIENVLAKYENSDTVLKNALLIAQKKLSSVQYSKTTDQKKKEKLFRFLISKGYSAEIIKNTLKKLHFDQDAASSFD
jgi:regulatory protein